ncbi:MAG: His-Xaa-Ser system protein HxsD [Minicystis sp.]
MSETTLFDDGWAGIEFDEDLYPKDAVYGASYVFIDRCYLHLERAGEKRFRVRLRAKTGKQDDTRIFAGDFENEILGQAYRQRIAGENRVLIEAITSRAIAGAAGPPGLDDLLAMEIGEETAFDDPLGIAMSWEEKYTKKKGEKAAAEAPKEAAITEGTPAEAASEKKAD